MRPSLLFRTAALAWALLSSGVAPASAQAPASDAESTAQAPAVPPPGPPPAAPDPDRWVLQWSSRLGQGFGSTLGSLHDEFLNEVTIRTDVLFGRPGDRRFRIGPALDLRSVDFATIEYAAGAMLLIPTHPGWPIQLSTLAGYANRSHRLDANARSGAIFVATAAFGYRSFNYHGHYGLGINFYASGRVHLDDPSAYEITGGIELDFLLAAVVPVMMVRMAAQSEDPDEPEEEGDGEQRAPAAPAPAAPASR